uniref:Myeloid differentiation primary response protein MyD88 n=1 Tax=Eptatretus burgeri TaxID=7764 RepID=A0A8C4QWF3_EPTBU
MANKQESTDHCNVPLCALNMSVRKRLALYLNPPAVGAAKDWTGLAELMGFEFLEIRNWERHQSPTEAVMEAWGRREHSKATVGRLLELLHELGREDAITDVGPLIDEDCERYHERLAAPLQVPAVDSSQQASLSMSLELVPITIWDDPDGRTVEKFDAFLCYCEADISFVKELIQRLEGNKSKLRLCVFDRDVLPGQCLFSIASELIEHRCRKMVVIITDEFLQSEQCDFQTKFALSLAPGAREKRLIPLLYKPIKRPYPSILRHITMCDYTKEATKEWFWERLAKSIKC